MGNAQSMTPDEEPLRTIIIDEWEIPEAYKNVAVSDEVVNAVQDFAPTFKIPAEIITTSDSPLSKEDEKQPDLDRQLKDKFLKLSEARDRQAVFNADMLERLKKRNQAFNDGTNLVKQQYFDQQNDGICRDVENQILRCLISNKTTMLNCASFLFNYQQCVNQNRDKLLHENIDNKS